MIAPFTKKKNKEVLMEKGIAGMTLIFFLMGTGFFISPVGAENKSPLAGTLLADKKDKKMKEGEEKKEGYKAKEEALEQREEQLKKKEEALKEREEQLKKKEGELKAREQRLKKRTPPPKPATAPQSGPQTGTPQSGPQSGTPQGPQPSGPGAPSSKAPQPSGSPQPGTPK
jgi:hypothetical protein